MKTILPSLVRQLLLAIAILSIVSCGSGGDGDGDAGNVSGNAIKGPIKDAEVKLFYFDDLGQEVEIIATNAPVKTAADGSFSFDASFKDLPKSIESGILRTVGGTTEPDNGAAPMLETVIPDVSKLGIRHMSMASSVAASLLKHKAETKGAAPSTAEAQEVISRVEKELDVDLNDDPSDEKSSIAAMNTIADALFSLKKSSINSSAVNEYVKYLAANLASSSGKLDGNMRVLSNPDVDIPAAIDQFGSGVLAAHFPGGIQDLRQLRVSSDKDQIENDGLDSVILTVSVSNGIGEIIPISDTDVLDNPVSIELKVISGRGMLGKKQLSKWHQGKFQFDVRVSSLWEGPLSVEVSYKLKNGNVLTQTVPVDVVDATENEEDLVAPQIVNAGAIRNTEVVVTFSEPLRGGLDGAENPDFYSITANVIEGAPDFVAFVDVIEAVLIAPDYNSVRLTTQSQSGILYNLQASNLRDLAGNSFEPPTRFINPSNTPFVGIAAGGADIVDSDGDGLSDSTELFGWAVTITTPSGMTDTTWVTSDPNNADTDGDGVTDNEEKHGGINPRGADSDGDTLTDNQEWNVIYSDPSNQDTDGDGTQDGFEFYSYRTSPVLADTDGDQISDTDEVLGRNRDPRIADLPLHGITIGDIRLQIDERYTYEDAQGNTVTNQSSSTVTLTSSEKNTRNTTFSGNAEAFFEGNKGVVEGKPTSLGKLGFKVGAGIQISKESAIESQRVREEAIAKSRELSKTSTVTREIVGASVDVDLNIINRGDLAFSITNIELTLLQRSRESTRRFVPVATLIANSALITGESPTFNLGPLTPVRGPIVFSARDVFPNLISEMMLLPPGGLIFEVANYDIVDEYGRVFTFSNQLARDRTGGIVIDSGDGEVERHLIATALQPDPGNFAGGGFVGGFNSDGSPIGLPIDFVLQDTMQLAKNATIKDGIVAGPDQRSDTTATGDDIQIIPPGTTGVSVGSIVVAAGDNGVLDSTVHPNDLAQVTTGYATSATCSADSDKPRNTCEFDSDCQDASLTGTGSCTGPEILSRFGSLSTGDFDRKWVVLTNGLIPAGAEFSQLTLKPGEDIYFVFIQDLDQDGIFAREEFFSGSTDSSADKYLNADFGKLVDPLCTLGCELVAPAEIADGEADSKDTDRDGLGDFAEIRVGWKVSADGGLLSEVFPSPRLVDSDGDGLFDPVEQDLRAFCEQPADYRIDALCRFQSNPFVSQGEAIAIIAGADGTAETLAINDDEQLIAQGVTGLTFATQIIGPGANGVIDTPLSGSNEYQSVQSSLRIPPATNPYLSDTDFDGVEDYAELTGFSVGLSIRDGGNGIADTQAIGDDVQQAFIDGPVSPGGIVVLPGPNTTLESVLGGDDVLTNAVTVITDPLRRDTDADLVSDGRERDLGGDPTNPDDGAEFRDSDQDGLSDTEESVLGWLVKGKLVLSNPSRPDSDFDGLPDFAERVLRTDPNNPDTDGDLIRDYDEVAGSDFEQFFGFDEQFPGFSIDASLSRQYGTDPTRTDTDSDGLTDYFELLVGYRVLLGGESTFRQVYTNPLVIDSDLDGRSDYEEAYRFDPTDATDPDTDDDSRSDGLEHNSGTDPLVPDVGVSIAVDRLVIDRITDAGGANGAELTWWVTVQKNSDNPFLLSSPWDVKSKLPAIMGWYYLQGDPGEAEPYSCALIGNIPEGSNPITFVLNQQRKLVLEEGDSISIRGIIAEGDATTADCGVAPNYIPTFIRSGCATHFGETFTYEDFQDGGEASFPFPDGTDTAENCEWEMEIHVNGQ